MSLIPANTISQLVRLIEATPFSTSTKLVAIDGRGGSGKSSLAEALVRTSLKAQLVHVDDFPCTEHEYPFHPSGTQTRVNLVRLISEVLVPLRAGKRAEYQKTPWWTSHFQHPNASLVATPGGTVIVEGCYALHRIARELFDLRIWVDCPPSVGIERALIRDKSPEIRDIWRDVYVPNESAYISAHRPQDAADIVIYNDFENLFVIDEERYTQILRQIRQSEDR